MTIVVITTGGTIGAKKYPDPRKPPLKSTMPQGDKVGEVLRTSFASFRTARVPLPPRDSKDIDHAYRLSILDVVSRSPHRAFLVTHGTDAMIATADFFHYQFGVNPSLPGRKVILTGAMTPLDNGPASDGFANLAFSLRQLDGNFTALPPVSIILCDFDAEGNWTPRLYPCRPFRYEKYYDADGRYNRLRLRTALAG